MDLTTIIGLIIGFVGLIGGFLVEGGAVGMLLKETAGMIVLGGTIGATVASFRLDELKTVPGGFVKIFTNQKVDFAGTVDKLVETADKARREGLLSLESQLTEIDNAFLRRGLQLVIDGTDPELTRNMLDMEIAAFEEREKVGIDIFMTAGGFAPTMGIIGTVMGLVQVLSNIAEPDKLAGAIAVAFIATLYGVATANLLWLPFGNKLKVKSQLEVTLMELILEGILSIQAGENPRVIKEKLMTFLPPQDRRALIRDEATGLEM